MAPLRLLTALSMCLPTATAFSSRPNLPSSSVVRPLSSLHATNYLHDRNYNQIIMGDHNKAVLVVGGAKWCGPCKLIEPFVAQAADKYSEEMEVVKLDVEAKNNGAVKVEFLMKGVLPEALPSLMLFRDGMHLATHTGALTFDQLDEFIATNLQESAETEIQQEIEQELVGAGGGGRGFISLAGGARDDYAL